jgi:hypothetical protein
LAFKGTILLGGWDQKIHPNKKKKMIQFIVVLNLKGVTILWGQQLKNYIQIYFSENWRNMIFILFCLGLKGKNLHEKPPKIPSNFIFQYI